MFFDWVIIDCFIRVLPSRVIKFVVCDFAIYIKISNFSDFSIYFIFRIHLSNFINCLLCVFFCINPNCFWLLSNCIENFFQSEDQIEEEVRNKEKLISRLEARVAELISQERQYHTFLIEGPNDDDDLKDVSVIQVGFKQI